MDGCQLVLLTNVADEIKTKKTDFRNQIRIISEPVILEHKQWKLNFYSEIKKRWPKHKDGQVWEQYTKQVSC